MNGNQTPVSVEITEEAMALGPEVRWYLISDGNQPPWYPQKLSDAVTQALKEAHGNSTAVSVA